MSKLPPLVRALKASANQNNAEFQFPGHNRGQAAPAALVHLIGFRPFLYDITEIPDEVDRFSLPKGPLLEAKQLAADLFGAKETWFLVGGTTCGVQAAVMATCSPGDTIILPRNAHVSATTGAIFSGALPKYIVPSHNSDWDIPAGVTPSQVKLAIEESMMEGRKVGAVFVTSPTYHGVCSNLFDISRICHFHEIPLIVDEAHGAHFKFHQEMPETAMQQGADIVVQSTHKVLSSFSQSSMLHISGQFIDRERVHKCLHALQSTSPNWLLLASLDSCRHQLSTNPKTIFNDAVKLANKARALIGGIPGISILDVSAFSSDFHAMDPLRITIGTWQLGLTGSQANKILKNEQGIVPELTGTKSITLVFGLGSVREHVNRLVAGLDDLSVRFWGIRRGEITAYNYNIGKVGKPEIKLSPREAFFAKKEEVKIEECCGKVCGEFVCPHPPGIPVLVPGEVIDEKALNYLREVIAHGGFIMGPADPKLASIYCCVEEEYHIKKSDVTILN